ncbi:dolichyl-diphosphooligosaccharide--protein glycotransferase subunit OST1 Ecym_8278 [Eremothecium cymbalariae DBVPG|uniref:Dolichyl-diphosphooligosaccharide--protein glycosyltransferase subunit 1 n=1 Tax=Eremothecium cymbalariae (strain CBS 270.75 / DBVPG 7215 / KCTC 17166 / NRRL Y-17582) TaxID=931890 RepID=G8JXI6_ERECY|nr:Hypothetical protein Ecym_8278 [Eremothecium cymbalariae DBVPG\
MIFFQLIATVILLLSPLSCGLLSSATPKANWENVEFKRIVNVLKSYPHESLELVIKNIGSTPESHYYFTLPEKVFKKASIFSASLPDHNIYVDSSPDAESTVREDSEDIRYILVQFPFEVAPDQEIRLNINFMHNAGLKPYPEHIQLGTPQNLLLNTNKLPHSLYRTLKYNLEFVGGQGLSEVPTFQDSSSDGQLDGEVLKFGPILNIEPFTQSNVSVTYVREAPSVRVINLNRNIWISHWANTIQFDEYYEVTNDAAKLKDGFSRAEFMKGQYALKPGSYLIGFEMMLPEESTDHYYTDLVGMVSTYKIISNHMFLKPRYPLFGGWFYNFTIGWTNELSQFLHTDGAEQYIASIPILNGPLDTFYDHANISIYLPEGAEILDLKSTLPISNVNGSTEHSFFDLSSGHVKVTVEINNLVDNAQKAQLFIKYKYSKYMMYRKPINIAAYIFVALMSFFFLKQINFRIDP